MPILIVLCNTIFSKEILESKYNGGIEGFKRDFNIQAPYPRWYQEDYELISISTMNSDEINIDKLMANGLHYDMEKQSSTDFCMVGSRIGSLWEVNWLKAGRLLAYHENTLDSLKELSDQWENTTMDEVQKKFKNQDYPFKELRIV